MPGSSLSGALEEKRLSCVATCSTFFVDVAAAVAVLVTFVVGTAYFLLYARFHLVANAPEEEFARLAEAESDLR